MRTAKKRLILLYPTANYERSEENRPKERRQTKGQENVTLNKAYQHNGKPERTKS
jgi:hypothetical protein